MRGRNISAGKHEISRPVGHAGTQRNIVEIRQMMLIAGRLLRRVDSTRRMRVNRPAAKRDRIRKIVRNQKVRLREHMLANETPALAFAWQKTKPFERPVR